jgi:hypothetical protein
MNKSLFVVASAITILASGLVSAQTSMNGPYYANPSWDQQLPAAQRFIVLSNWNNEAVLDRETGLIWQRTPSNFLTSWDQAVNQLCRFVVATGGRKGWRLPTAEELETLVDPTQQNPALPAGHPFLGVMFSFGQSYWAANSITTTDTGQILAAIVSFSPTLGEFIGVIGTTQFVWCVRGGSGPLKNPTFPLF